MREQEGLADLLEPAPDLEFGPTVSLREMPEPPPPSIRTASQLVTPLAFPVEAPRPRAPRLVRARAAVARSLAELLDAWRSTSDVLDETIPTTRLVPMRAIQWARRVRALVGFWDWDRDDHLRGAFIGGSLLVVVLAVASSIEAPRAPAAAGDPREVRAPRTLDPEITPLARTICGRARR